MNINKPNLVMIYHKTDNKVQRREFNEFRSDTIKDLIAHFEKTYVFIDTSLIKTSTNSNKSCLGTSVSKPIRSAPYQVPSNKNNRNFNFNRNQNQTKFAKSASDVGANHQPVNSQKEISQGMLGFFQNLKKKIF